MKIIRIILLLSTILIVLANKSAASGLKTHVWIAHQILDDLSNDCQFVLAGSIARVNKSTCEAILNNQNHFIAGTLGPDIFPDLITGQVTAHPGIPNDWQTSDFLKHILFNANSSEEIAFAYGYLVHAASDTFAHTYVNGYAGDVFSLGDERAVELRHFVLEKYIDSKLPETVSFDMELKAPEKFLSKLLILNKNAARTSLKSGTSLHISSMYGVYKSVLEIDNLLEGIEDIIGGFIAKVIAEQIDISAQIADGEVALKIAEEALNLNEKQLEAQKKILDEAHKVLQDAIDALDKNRNLISTYELQAKIADEAINESRRIASEAIKSIEHYNNEVIKLRRNLLNIPDKICNEIAGKCRDVCRIPFVCDLVCEPAKLVCKVNGAYTKVQNEILNFEQKLNQAQSRLAQAGIDEAANIAKKANNLQKKAAEAGLTAGFELARAAAQAAYDVQKAKYDLQLEATKEARKNAKALRDKIEELRKTLIDKESIESTIRDLLDHANFLSFYSKNWVKGIEISSKEYISASKRVGQGLLVNEGNILDEYAEWLSCYGGAFTAVPYQAGQWPCEAKSRYEELSTEIENFVVRHLPPPFDEVYKKYLDVKSHIKNQVKNEVTKASIELVKIAVPDDTTGEFIEILIKPEYATASKLNDVFSNVGDSAGKKLLVFNNIIEDIHNDMGLKNDKLSPTNFAAFKHAITLSKLAILDKKATARLIYELGGDPDLVGGEKNKPYSVLLEMLKSIDGNHQWQPYGIMYARSDGKHQPQAATERRWGYGIVDNHPRGMPHFANPSMRNLVFKKLFPEGIAGRLSTHTAFTGFPFSECKSNPFPVTFNADGSPRQFDNTCSTLNSEYEKTVWDSVRIFFRRLGLKLGLSKFNDNKKTDLPSCAVIKIKRKRVPTSKIPRRIKVIDYSRC